MTPAKPRQRGSEMSEEKLSVRLEARAAEMDRRLGATDVQALLREAAQLVRRVEEAPVCEVAGVRPALPIYEVSPVNGLVMRSMCGQRVRLVREA